MGKLSEAVSPSAEVKYEHVPGGSFTVRAVSFDIIAQLAATQSAAMAAIFAKFMAEKERGLAPETIGMFITLGLREAPELAHQLIALAAGEPDQVSTVAKMPLVVQMDALEKIVGLTFSGSGDLKKLVEIVTRMFEGVQNNVDQLTLPGLSSSGNGSFASR